MAKDYKLCPKCNNALDKNIIQCPYCGEKLGITFETNNGSYQKQETFISNTKNIKGCLIIFIISFIVPFILSIISFIITLISSFFETT